MKTRKSVLKRLKKTAKGKWVHQQSNTSHLAANKSKKQKQRLDRPKLAKKSEQARLMKLING